MLLHDIAEYQQDFGVYLLWEALRDRYPHFEFTHGHGLGIVGLGAEIPEQVGALFAASTSAAASQAIRASLPAPRRFRRKLARRHVDADAAGPAAQGRDLKLRGERVVAAVRAVAADRAADAGREGCGGRARRRDA